MEQLSFQEKRFRLKEDAYAREKLHALQSGLKKIQAEHPEVIGATAFGSLTTGKGHEKSDIDCFVFVDVTPATIRIQKIVGEQRGKTPPERGQKGGMPAGFNSRLLLMKSIFERSLVNSVTDESIIGLERSEEDAAGSYWTENGLDEFYENLVEKTVQDEFRTRGHQNTLEVSPVIIPMSISAIDAVIQERLLPNGRQEMKFSVTGTPETHKKGRGYFASSRIGAVLGCMFHMDIGGGIRPYREHVVKRLSEAGPRGEKMWSEIADYVQRWEGSEWANRNIRFPSILEEALRIYAPRKTTETVDRRITA